MYRIIYKYILEGNLDSTLVEKLKFDFTLSNAATLYLQKLGGVVQHSGSHNEIINDKFSRFLTHL